MDIIWDLINLEYLVENVPQQSERDSPIRRKRFFVIEPYCEGRV